MTSLEEKESELKEARELISENNKESLENAIDIYLNMLNHEPKNSALLAAVAKTYLNLNEPLMANIYAGEAVAFDRKNPNMWDTEAQTFEALGKYDYSAKCRRIASRLRNE